MEMEMLVIVLIGFLCIVGALALCLVGDRFRKVSSALMSFMWGFLFWECIWCMKQGRLLQDGLFDIDGNNNWIFVAVILCVISIWWEKFSVPLNAFLMSFCLLFFALPIYYLISRAKICTILALVLAIVAYLKPKHVFRVEIVIFASFFALLIFASVIDGVSYWNMLDHLTSIGEEVYFWLIWGVGTLILGIILYFIKKKLFKKQKPVQASEIDQVTVSKAAHAENILPFVVLVLGFLLVQLSFREASVTIVNYYNLLLYVNAIGVGAYIGFLVYSVLTKDLKFNIVLLYLELLLYLTGNAGYFGTGIGPFRLLTMLSYFLIWVILWIAVKMIKKDEIKPLLVMLIAAGVYFVYFSILLDELGSGYSQGYYYHLQNRNIVIYLIRMISLFVTVFLSFRLLRGTNIFQFKSKEKVQSFVKVSKEASDNPLKEAQAKEEPIKVLGKDPADAPVVKEPTQKSKARMKRCTQCQKIVYKQAKFCEDCGGKLQTICVSCGKEVDENAEVCGNCGKKL